MREVNIEIKLRDSIRALGGMALKWVSPGTRGVPDRIILLPGGRIYFIEVKAPGRTATELQLYWMARLARLGFDCRVLDSVAGVDDFIRQL